jgi:hypothetical protein
MTRTAPSHAQGARSRSAFVVLAIGRDDEICFAFHETSSSTNASVFGSTLRVSECGSTRMAAGRRCLLLRWELKLIGYLHVRPSAHGKREGSPGMVTIKILASRAQPGRTIMPPAGLCR